MPPSARLRFKGGGTHAAPVVLNALSLGSPTFVQGSTVGTLISSILGTTTGSLVEVIPADARVSIDSGSLLVGSTVASVGSFSITLVETLAGAISSPRSTPLTITVTAAAAPALVAAPTISGTAIEGYGLTATPGVWNNVTSASGQWMADGIVIVGATALTYRLAETEINKTMTYYETATGPGGTDTSTSSPTGTVQSGLIARNAMYGGAVNISAAYRWAETISTDTTQVPRLPDSGPGKGNGTIGYEVWSPTGASFATNQGGYSELYLRGQANITGASGNVQIAVPIGVPLKVKLACGGGGTAAVEWSIREGANGAELASASVASLVAGQVLAADGNVYDHTLWLSSDQGAPPITSTTGIIAIRRKASGALYSCTLRAVEVSYPDFGLNTSSSALPGNIVYSDTTGSDTTGTGVIGLPFQHLPGDPGGAGVVSVFSLTAGAQALAQGGQTFRPASYTGRSGKLIYCGNAGTALNPIIFGSYGTGKAIHDGSVALTGWAAITAGDTAAFASPDAANIQKKTGLTGTETIPTDGEDWMFPAQFPNPTNPADFDMSYIGNDGFITLTAAQFATQVDSGVGGAGYTCGSDGNAGTGYRKYKFTSPDVQTQYSGSSINLNGYSAILMITGNRLADCLIVNHVPATGYFEAVMADTTTIFVANSSVSFVYCIRGCPFDIRKYGQYAYNVAGDTLYGHFASATRGRLSADLTDGFSPTVAYNTLDGVVLRRVGYSGGAVRDSGGGTLNQGINVKNSTISQCVGLNRVIAFKASNAGSYSTGQLTNVTIENIAAAGIEATPGLQGSGVKIRDSNGTSLLTGNAAAVQATWDNLDFCDMVGIHADGIAAYLNTANHTFRNMVSVNVNIPLSTQGGNGIVTRNNTFKDMFLLGRKNFTGQTSGATLYTWQLGDGETGIVAEGLCLPDGRVLYGRSASSGVSNQPSTGGVIKNCVLGAFIAQPGATSCAGLTMQDCLILNWNSEGIQSVAEFVSLGGVDGGGNTVLAAGATTTSTWNGGITQAMRAVLTKIHGAGYADRNIGFESTAFGGTGKTLIVPAVGTTFTLTDTWITTDKCRARFRVGLQFGVLMSPEPDIVYSLPVAGDNTMFAVSAGYVRWLTSPSAGTYSLVVDKTCSNADVVGGPGTVKRTTIPITVV